MAGFPAHTHPATEETAMDMATVGTMATGMALTVAAMMAAAMAAKVAGHRAGTQVAVGMTQAGAVTMVVVIAVVGTVAAMMGVG